MTGDREQGSEEQASGDRAEPEALEPFEVTVPELLAGVRVDRAVAFLTGASRRVAADLVAAGSVWVGGRAVTEGRARLLAGQKLQVIDLSGVVAEVVAPEPETALVVVHEDDHLVVVDKPAGQVVHPGAGRPQGTVVGAVVARYPDVADLGRDGTCDPTRPGIVHRLDRPTSGLLVVARTPHAYGALVEQFSARQVQRRYVGMVHGVVEEPEGIVDAPIGRSERQPTLMAVTAAGRAARTRYRVVARGPQATLLELALETGRTHQIRVHMAAIGHPVLGDVRYGAPPGAAGPERIFLHAAHLGFRHPAGGGAVAWESPLPPDLEAIKETLAR